MADKLLYRPAEAAKVLSISRARLYRLLAAGDILSARIGGARVITREALEAYVASLDQKGGTAA